MNLWNRITKQGEYYKFDREKDNLGLEFDLETKQYVFYVRYTAKYKSADGKDILKPEKVVIPYNRLNRKSQIYLNEQNNMLIKNEELLKSKIEEAKIKERFKKMATLGFQRIGFEVTYHKDEGSLSESMRDYLNTLVNEKNVLLGIHRVSNRVSMADIEKILTEGLDISPDYSNGSIIERKLSDTVSYYPDNKTIIKELMFADSYKNSPGSILIRIPDEELGECIFVIDEKGRKLLKPKYILGYVPISSNHHLERIITKESFQASPINNYDPNTENTFINNDSFSPKL